MSYATRRGEVSPTSGVPGPRNAGSSVEAHDVVLVRPRGIQAAHRPPDSAPGLTSTVSVGEGAHLKAKSSPHQNSTAASSLLQLLASPRSSAASSSTGGFRLLASTPESIFRSPAATSRPSADSNGFACSSSGSSACV